RDRVVETIQDVEPIRERMAREPGRPTADRNARDAPAIRVEEPDGARSERGHPESLAVGLEGHLERKRQALLDDRGRAYRRVEVDVRVDMDGADLARLRIDDRDAALGDVAAHAGLEADDVSRVEVRRVDLSGHRVDGEVEDGRPDARGEADLSRRVRGRVDREDVLVGEVEAHAWRPVASDRVEPLPALVVEADDDADIGRGDAIVALER